MKYKYTAITAIAVMVAFLVLAFEGSSPAPAAEQGYTQRETVTFTNKTATTATDFHVKFWQKEDWIEVKSWNGPLVSPSGSCTSARGFQPDEVLPGIGNPHQNGDNGKHAVDVMCTDLAIAPGASLTLTFEWTLTNYNTKRTYKPTWSHGLVPADADIAAPNAGWTIADPVLVPDNSTPCKFNHKFELCNDDPTQAITVPELKLGSAAPPLLTFEQLGNFASWDSTVNPGTLNPGQCYAINVVTVGPLTGGNIVASYKLVDGSQNTIMQDKLAHQVPPPAEVGGVAEISDVDASALGATASGGSSSAPYAPIAGAAGVIVLGAGGWYARRRWLS